MLNKNNLQIAEQVAKECAPLFKKCALLLKKARESADKSRVARDRANYWLYVKSNGGNPYGDYITEEEKALALRTRETDTKKWRETYEQLFIDYNHASNEATAREINYKNYIDYTLKVIGEKLRPVMFEIKERKGLETLGAILEKSAHGLRPRFWLDDIYYNLERFTLGANIYGGLNTTTTYLYYVFGNEAQNEIKPPKLHNGATYEKALAKLEEIRRSAEALAKKSREIATKECLYKYVDIIGHIATTK